ncbi:MAG TPA: putative sulfate exporter family transporter [Hydrogenispora sp.]|nr:putative sulfate exporter family transporter [Hydrogenispora sp.]
MVRTLFNKLLKYLPGMVLMLVVGYAGKIVAQYVPHSEYVLFAIAIGMLVRNLLPLPQIFAPGIATYELWMKTGIVLLGARLVLQEVFVIGASGIVMVVIEIAVAIAAAAYLGRIFGLKEKLASLLGIGIGVCGVSAIISSTSAIEAEEEDAAYAIAIILLFGAIMLFLYPALGTLLGMSDLAFGYWTGLSIDNTAEAVATGFAYSEAAGNIATVVKLSRNALMGVVVLLMALYYARKGISGEVENKAAFLWSRLPKFLLGFLAFSLLATVGFLTPGHAKILNNASKWLFMVTFAGVGLSTDFKRMKAGIKPFLVGFGVETIVSVVTFALVYYVIG